METNVKNILTKTISWVSMLVALLILAGACSKSSTSSNTKSPFIGTYYGSLSSGGSDTIVIAAGSGSAVVLNSRTSKGAIYSINATVVNDSTLNIPSQSVYVNTYAQTFTVTGAGTLKNSSALTVSMFFGSINLVFTGTKQ